MDYALSLLISLSPFVLSALVGAVISFLATSQTWAKWKINHAKLAAMLEGIAQAVALQTEKTVVDSWKKKKRWDLITQKAALQDALTQFQSVIVEVASPQLKEQLPQIMSEMAEDLIEKAVARIGKP